MRSSKYGMKHELLYLVYSISSKYVSVNIQLNLYVAWATDEAS